MSNLPPVDWGALKPEAQVHRSYRGPETEVGPIEWACPACGEKNQTPLAQGCGHCGSGKPGQHVGVDPVVTPEERLRRLQHEQEHIAGYTPIRRMNMTLVPAGDILVDVFGAFAQWIDSTSTPTLSAAFRAGWEARGGQVPDDNATPRTTHRPADAAEPLDVPPPAPSVGGEQESTAAGDTATFTGTAVQRTTLAALIVLRENFYGDQPEEVRTGEWLTLTQLNALIADTEKDLA